MIGKIRLIDYRLQGIIGVYPEERVQEQELILNLVVTLDLAAAIKTDAISDTIDYEELKETCSKVMQEGRYFLLEKLAYEMLDALFQKWKSIKGAKIELRKKEALVELER